MDEKTNESEKKACCTKSCCGKAGIAVALLLVGGIGGYLCGRNCTKICPVEKAAVAAPAQP